MRGRRGPVLAGVGVGVLALLLVVLLVLPKMNEVSSAREELDQARSEQQTLESQVRALEDAREAAGAARRTIAEVDQQIPPTADQPGMILLLQNAAVASGLDLVTVTPSNPVFVEEAGFSSITVSVTGNGSYFDVAEFMFKIETLPRAAKTLALALAPGGDETAVATTFGSPELAMTATIELYTSDTSAGPGSIPGPTTEAPPEAGA
jgi:Tfp pilus assembly protein PilO